MYTLLNHQSYLVLPTCDPPSSSVHYLKTFSFKLDCSAWPNGTLKKPVSERNRVTDAHVSPYSRYRIKYCEYTNSAPSMPRNAVLSLDDVESFIRRIAETICDVEPELTKLDVVAGVSLLVVSPVLISSLNYRAFLLLYRACSFVSIASIHWHCEIVFSYHLTHRHVIINFQDGDCGRNFKAAAERLIESLDKGMYDASRRDDSSYLMHFINENGVSGMGGTCGEIRIDLYSMFVPLEVLAKQQLLEYIFSVI